VRNFLAQEKRVQSKINLMVNKGGKSGERDDNVRFLAARIGNRSLVTKQGALCAGTFNSSLGVNASIVASDLFQCNSTIREACGKHEKVNQTEKDNILRCSNVMHKFKNVSNICEAQVNNCTCWKELYDLTPDIKGCNIAKDAEKKINDEHKSCKAAFIKCSKLEDEAL